MSRSSSNNSNAERRFREEMADYDEYDEYDLPGDEYEFAGELRRGNQESPNLLEQIRNEGRLSGQYHMLNQQRRNEDDQESDMERYGSQNNGQYSMENFIVEVLELDMSDENTRSMMNWGEAGQVIIDKAVEAINSDKSEIHFTPRDDTEYKKIKLIYDKLASDIKKMICIRLGIKSCPHNSDEVIRIAHKKYPDIRFKSGMTFGYKLKAIEDYLEAKTTAEARGRKKTRRRVMSKKRPRGRPRGKTKRRRARSKKM